MTSRMPEGERLYYVKLFLSEEGSMRDFCKIHDLPFSSFKRWVNFYQDFGEIPTNGKRSKGTLSKNQERALRTLMQQHKNASVKKLHEMLEEHEQTTIPKVLVRRLIQECGTHAPDLRPEKTHTLTLHFSPKQQELLQNHSFSHKYETSEELAAAIVLGDAPAIKPHTAPTLILMLRKSAGDFGKKMLFIRCCYGVTMFEAARRLGTNVETYRKLEKGAYRVEKPHESTVLTAIQGADEILTPPTQLKLAKDPDFVGGF